MESLPVEICDKIFAYLSAEDLARCSMVSRKWRMLCTDERLWKRLVSGIDLGNENLVPPPGGPDGVVVIMPDYHAMGPGFDSLRGDREWRLASKYKTWYGRKLNSLRRWEENRYWTHNVDEESDLCVMGNGAVFVEVRQKELRVVDASDGQLEAVETVRPCLPANITSLGHVEAFNEQYLVLRAEGSAAAFLCYAWTGGRLVFIDGVYGLYRDKIYSGKIVLASIRGCAQVPLKSRLVQWRSVTLGRERLLLRTFDDRSTAYVWSLTESRCLGVIDCGSIANGDIYSYGEDFYFCAFMNLLVKCDGTGVRKFSLELNLNRYWISGYCIHFNPSVVLLELSTQPTGRRPHPEGRHRLLAFDWDFTPLACTFSEHDQLKLHPRLPVISRCKKHSYSSLFQISLRDLRTDTLLWTSEFSPISHSSNVLDRYTFANLNFIGTRFVVLVLSEVQAEKLLLDMDTGKTLFHDVLEKCHTIEYVGEKVIVAWDSECDGLSFKKVVVYT
ncbi:hypothetical protein AAG570_003415 [Ranatra chinensis]|uniref:F-box domain-containing protein n=1 Tax=Ranatra chinensis TaxID=642074 RepID=A0ABD0YLN4_9HEMI